MAVTKTSQQPEPENQMKKQVYIIRTDGDGNIGVCTNAKEIEKLINNYIDALGYQNPDKANYNEVLKIKNQGWGNMEIDLGESTAYIEVQRFTLNN